MANIPILQIWDEVSGKYIPIPAIQGLPYTLTDADKAEIAELVLAAIPDGTEVAY